MGNQQTKLVLRSVCPRLVLAPPDDFNDGFSLRPQVGRSEVLSVPNAAKHNYAVRRRPVFTRREERTWHDLFRAARCLGRLSATYNSRTNAVKVRVIDSFGGTHTKRFWLPVVTLEEARKYNPAFGTTHDEI